MRARLALLAALALAACGREAPPRPTFHAEGNPETLAEWGVLTAKNGVLELSEGAEPYDLATPLFSDYALKLRTLSLPEGESAVYDAQGAFDLPVGTIISKTFYYETGAGGNGESGNSVRADGARIAADGRMALSGLRLIETRILARRETGWIALPYLWNAAQTEARLKRTGAVIPLELVRADGRREAFDYLVPNVNQCAGCHATDNTTRAIEPIGIKARHLNKPSSFHEGFNQLDYWLASGMLTFPGAEDGAGDPSRRRSAPPQDEEEHSSKPHPEEGPHSLDPHPEEGPQGPVSKDGQIRPAGAPFPQNAAWDDHAAPLEARARAYLDANCSHCHSDTGPADTSGLDLRPSTPLGPAYGVCKAPIASGSGSGGRPYDIVPGAPDRSITLFRMETNDPAAMMPELGRAVTHEEGATLIREWIAAMEGECR